MFFQLKECYGFQKTYVLDPALRPAGPGTWAGCYALSPFAICPSGALLPRLPCQVLVKLKSEGGENVKAL